MLRGAEDAQGAVVRRVSVRRRRDLFLAGEILGGERTGARKQRGQVAEEDDPASSLTGARSHVEHEVSGANHVRVVLHDDDRVARVAQPVEHADQPADVPGMQPDARLIKDKERVDEGGPQGGGEVDPLDLAAAQGPRLPVQGEVAQPHVRQVARAGS